MKKLCLCLFLLVLMCSAVFSQEVISGPYTLEECIAAAILSNSDLKIARNNLAVSGTNVTKALSSYFPQLSVSNDTFEIAESKHKTMDKGTTLSAALKIFDMGLRELNVSSAKYSEKQQQQNYYRTFQTVLYNVYSAYYNSLRYKELLKVSESSVAYYEELEKETNAQIENGTAAPVDILSIQSQLANSRVELLSSRNNTTNSLNKLQNAIGLFITGGFDVSGSIPEEYGEIKAFDEYWTTAIASRPDLLGQDYAIKAAETDKKIALRDYLPQLNITGSYNRYFDKDREFDNDARIMGTINFNIFDGLSREANVKAKKLSLENAKENRVGMEKDLAESINSLYTALTIARERISASEKGLESAMKNREVQTEKYSAGLATNLDILNAQMQLDTALSNNINAKYDYIIDLTEMDYETGVLGVDRYEEK